MNLIEHIEGFLGELEKGWKPDQDYKGIQCMRFIDQPFKDLYTYVTLGLSDNVLALESKKVRQELIFSVHKNFDHDEVPSFLVSLAESIQEGKRGILRGEALGPHKKLFKSWDFVGVYASIPVFFEDEFYVFNGSVPPVVFVWLIPLYEAEIHFIQEKGWAEFENILERNNESGFWQLDRKTFV